MDLANKIERHIQACDRHRDARGDLFDRYMGEPYGKEVAGRSQVVTSEVFDTVEMATAELVDLLASDERIVSFAPDGPGDEQSAEAETDACNHIFWHENNGYEILQTYIKSGLIEQNGYVRAGWVADQETTVQTVETPDEASAEMVKELAHEQGLDFTAGDGYSELSKTEDVDRYEIDPIPQYRVLISARWHKICLQDCPFVAIEHDTYTRLDLKEMGFDPAAIDALSVTPETEEKDSRHNTKDNEDEEENAADKAMECPLVYECYILCEEDEKAVRYKVWYGGQKVLKWADGSEAKKYVDSVPIYSWTPVPVPHRHAGRSMAEITDDLQAINTNLTRHMIDNIAATQYPRPEVSSDQMVRETMADLANPAPGAAIRKRGTAPIVWQAPPSLVGSILPVVQHIADIKQERTGITRLNQGLDSETLNKTMGGQAQLLNQGQKRLKMIARNAAESLRNIFLGMHKDLRKGNMPELSYKSGAQWQTAQPQNWKPRSRMTVSVGTGNGDRAEKQQTLGIVAGFQRELAQSGSMMVDEAKLFETADRIVKMGGYSGAELFFVDPRSPEYQQKQMMAAQQPKEPDPAMVLAQAEAQKATGQAAKAQADAQLKMAQIQLDAQKEANRHAEKMADIQLREAAHDLNEAKTAADVEFKAEAQDLAEDVAQHNAEMDVLKMAQDAVAPV